MASNLKGLFAGSGSDALNNPAVCAEVVRLTEKSTSDITLLYLGTATYDSELAMQRQTGWFTKEGCTIVTLPCTTETPSAQDMKEKTEAADIILVSGGNSLYVIDRWSRIGLVPHLKAAMNRGVVLTGGSFGAICWFSAGHSDSMDPTSYRTSNTSGQEACDVKNAFSAWEYIRCPCLGFLPGLVCPHFDKVQSNGVLRALDFDEMMLRHATERGIGIDHWAALVVEGDSYRVFQAPDKPGSVLEDGTFSETQGGAPGVWIKDVIESTGVIDTRLAPPSGKLYDLIRDPRGGKITPDPRLAKAREENPQPE